MTLFYRVTSPRSPISGWVGRVIKRKATGWVTLRFARGIQRNFKAVKLEPVPRMRVPWAGVVAPDVSVNVDLDEARRRVLYRVVYVVCYTERLG